MLCDRCQGKCVFFTEGKPQPCEECGGMGIVHCCEGLQAQPEAEAAQGSNRPATGGE